MLYQEEMAAILEQSYIGRCDMCQAGNLQHPVTQMPLQKRTQIVTTSQIMLRRIETLQCDHNHEHDVIAGSCKHPKLGRMLVSQFSDLYTRAFAEKVIRCLRCSQQVEEPHWVPTESAPWSDDQCKPMRPQMSLLRSAVGSVRSKHRPRHIANGKRDRILIFFCNPPCK
jgi:hypothetical protein